MTSNEDVLLSFRKEFPILSSTTYLVSNSLGAMPRAVPERLLDYAEQWQKRGVRAWAEGWWEMPVKVGDIVAPLIGAAKNEIAMQPSVTHAMSVVLSSLDYPASRNKVVMTELDFPSVIYSVKAQAPRLGARVELVASEDGIGIDIDRLIDSIDEQTRLVAISHVLFRSAFIIDLEAVIRRAHEVGALVVADAYHSVGIVPIDVKALGVDFLAGGVLKWLCGGPGGAFLYTSPSINDTFHPVQTGWLAHERPFAFDLGMTHIGGARRWLGGTPSIPSLFAAMEGPGIVNEAGVDAVRAKSMHQTARLVELVDSHGWDVRAPRNPVERGGTVAIDLPNASEISQALLARDVIVDFRPGAGIRIAPHFYTHDDELERVVDEIAEIISSGVWETFSGQIRTVT